MSVEAAKKYLEEKTGDTYISPEQALLDPSAMNHMIETLFVLLLIPHNSNVRRVSDLEIRTRELGHKKPASFLPYEHLGFVESDLTTLLATYENVRDRGAQLIVVDETL